MGRAARFELIFCWLAFFAIFVFRPRRVKGRPAAATVRAAMWGLLLETAAVFIAWFPTGGPPGAGRAIASMLLAPAGIGFFWWAVEHLGRQFRIQAGLWPDHQLVRSGPYAVVRHPIYLGLFLMMLATALLRAAWPLVALAVALYAAGTEIRIRIEDRLLESRFGTEFEAYRRNVKAWVPPLR